MDDNPHGQTVIRDLDGYEFVGWCQNGLKEGQGSEIKPGEH
jgi:hypothetical protein